MFFFFFFFFFKQKTAYEIMPSLVGSGMCIRDRTLVANLEDAFDIMMETDDIIDLSSYEKGIEILTGKYGVEL